ncbi:hypothetical protein [Liquorilactobacillus hordei]|uniref:hypothetical protein n=1 Tax=Liquorilactobacillus hordei TaxID=468911 RepID=UPI00070FB2A7|nr:hypothetical protein [Liquorilactobacillus hordei]QYH52640.1 hypothetical protein G6O70_09465 [Liquorilactobacillus hordei DSM 19519]
MLHITTWMIVVLVILFSILAIMRNIKTKTNAKLQKKNKDITDAAFAASLERLGLMKNEIKLEISTSRLSDVWGSGVMAYEYEVDVSHKLIDDEFRAELTQYMQEYAQKKDLERYDNFPVFVVSDLWQEGNLLRVDITYAINARTVNYLRDIRRVD